MIGLGPSRTGAPVGVCSPPVVGLSGVIISDDRIHEEHLPGEAVLSTFSGSDSTVRLGCSSRRIFADSCLHLTLLTRVQHLCIELMDLGLVGGLLRHLHSPLRLE